MLETFVLFRLCLKYRSENWFAYTYQYCLCCFGVKELNTLKHLNEGKLISTLAGTGLSASF